jgi:hypothetical protein
LCAIVDGLNITEGTGPLDQDELEELLYDGMDESFNADIEDGSVEEVFFP